MSKRTTPMTIVVVGFALTAAMFFSLGVRVEEMNWRPRLEHSQDQTRLALEAAEAWQRNSDSFEAIAKRNEVSAHSCFASADKLKAIAEENLGTANRCIAALRRYIR